MTIYGILRALRGGWGLTCFWFYTIAFLIALPTVFLFPPATIVMFGSALLSSLCGVDWNCDPRRVPGLVQTGARRRALPSLAESGCNRTGTPRATGNVNFATGSSILTPKSRWHEPICPPSGRIPRSTLHSDDASWCPTPESRRTRCFGDRSGW